MDRITELTQFQRAARNTRNQLDHSSAAFADVTAESKFDPIIERERAELVLQCGGCVGGVAHQRWKHVTGLKRGQVKRVRDLLTC